MKMNQNLVEKEALSAPPQRDTPWNDPVYWKGVRIGQCINCKRVEKDITRYGLCWICEHDYTPKF